MSAIRTDREPVKPEASWTKLDYALEAARQGWRVFPAAPNDKAPLIDDWPDLATTDETQIRKWWAQWPEANISGLCDGLVVVDIDVKKGGRGIESLAALEAEIGALPHTRRHDTPSGGWHLIFTPGPGHRFLKRAFHPLRFPGIDIQVSKGAQVLLPGSTQPIGAYTLTDPAPVAEIPDEMQSIAMSWSQRNLPANMSDQRNVTMASFLGSIRTRGMSFEAMLGQARAFNALSALPLDEDELLRVVKSISHYPSSDLGGVSEANTDLANADWFSYLFSEHCKRLPGNLGWVHWMGTRWARDKTDIVQELARGAQLKLHDAAQRLEAEAIEKFGEDLFTKDPKLLTEEEQRVVARVYNRFKRAKSLQFQRTIRPMLDSVASVAGAKARLEDFDTQAQLLNCQNGTLDLATGELTTHNPDQRLSKITNASFHPDADQRPWQEFVLWLCQGDEAMAHWLQVAVGASSIGALQEHFFAFMHGMGSNGKSQFLEALRVTLGDYARMVSTDILVGKGANSRGPHTESIAALRGIRLAIAAEPDVNVHWNAELIKKLTGEETIETRSLYKEELQTRTTWTFWVTGNHEPKLRDHSGGMSRRMKLVPCLNKAGAGGSVPEVRNLGAKLAGDGVLAWIAEGAQMFLAAGATLARADAVEEATSVYVKEQDEVREWWMQWGVEPKARTATRDAFTAFKWWCNEANMPFVLELNDFGKQTAALARELGLTRVQVRPQGHTGNKTVNGWAGRRVIFGPVGGSAVAETGLDEVPRGVDS